MKKMQNRIDKNLMEPTMNGYGSMHNLTKFSKIFIDRCSKYKKPVIDIGCAYGVASIPALENGITVIANDIDDRHLDILAQRTPENLLKNLVCLKANFPHELNFHQSSLSSVHLSFVLSFLNGEEVRLGFSKIYKWLDSEGEIFIINYTPFMKMIEGFLSVYETKKIMGDEWPGYIEDLSKMIEENNYSKNLPNKIHHFDVDTLERELKKHGFVIELAEYFTLDYLPKEYKLNGKELVGVIAKKT